MSGDRQVSDEILAEAAGEVDETLLEWFLGLSVIERLRVTSRSAAAMERLARAASTTSDIESGSSAMENVETLPIEVYSQATNAVVLRVPGRRFPGVVIQGDTLSTLVADVTELCGAIERGESDALEHAQSLREQLRQLQAHYEAVLAAHQLPLPYAKPR